MLDKLRQQILSRCEWQEGCLVWTGCVNWWGYGQINIDGKVYQVHRVLFQIENGPIEKGMCVCHSCDNPPCCTIDHLWLGTHKENVADMFAKGRENDRRGESNGCARLSEEQVALIRYFLKCGHSHRQLARRYRVAKGTIDWIKSGLIWPDVAPFVPLDGEPLPSLPPPPLSTEPPMFRRF